MNVNVTVAKEVPSTPQPSESHPAKQLGKHSRPISLTTATPAPTETFVSESTTKPSVVKSKSTKDFKNLGLDSPMVISPATSDQ